MAAQEPNLSSQVSDSQQELRQQSIPELLRELSQQTTTLVRQEIDLAKAEMSRKAKHAGIGVGELGGAGILGLFALGALTAGVIAAVALALPVWAAALIVAAVYAAAAAVLAVTGRRKLAEAGPATPEQTVETVKEDVAWAKSRMSSDSR